MDIHIRHTRKQELTWHFGPLNLDLLETCPEGTRFLVLVSGCLIEFATWHSDFREFHGLAGTYGDADVIGWAEVETPNYH